MRQRCVTLIDLGEVGGFEEEDPQLPRPVPRWLRALGVPAGPKLAVAAAVVVLAGGLAGAAPRTPPQPVLHFLPEVDSLSSIMVTGDVLVEIDSEGPRAIRAFDIDGGRQLWAGVVGQDAFRLDAVPTGDGRPDGVLVQIADEGFVGMNPSSENMDRELAHGRATVVDALTGVERWRHPGNVISPSGGRTLTMLVAGDTEADWRLVGVDGRDGHEVWSRPFVDGTQWMFGYDRIRQAPQTDRLTLLDPADGAVIDVDVPTGRATTAGHIPTGGTILWAWGDYLGIRRPDPYARDSDAEDPALRPQRIEVHDLRQLDGAPLWSASIGTDQGNSPWPCELDRVCVPDGAQVVRLDIRTGGRIETSQTIDNLFQPGALGLWQIGGAFSEPNDAFVTVSAQASKTRTGWLGVVRLQRPVEVIPLLPIPKGMAIDNCWSGSADWIVCPGPRGGGTLAIRRSDLDALVAAVRPPGSIHPRDTVHP
jgi:hypothetical protein